MLYVHVLHTPSCKLQGAAAVGKPDAATTSSTLTASTGTDDPAALCANALTLLQKLHVQLGTGPAQPQRSSSIPVQANSQFPASDTQGTQGTQAPAPSTPKSNFAAAAQVPVAAAQPQQEFGAVVELNVCGTIMYAARGALLLGGPKTALAQSLGFGIPHPQAQHQPLQHSLRIGRDSSGRLFLPFRPHVFASLLDFLHELWGCLPPPVAHAPTRQVSAPVAARAGSGSMPAASPQPPASPSSQPVGMGAVGVSEREARAVRELVRSAQEHLLLRSLRSTDIQYLERLAEQLGLSELIFGDRAVDLAWAEATCSHAAYSHAVAAAHAARAASMPTRSAGPGTPGPSHAHAHEHHHHAHASNAMGMGSYQHGLWAGMERAKRTSSGSAATGASLERTSEDPWPAPGSLNMYKIMSGLADKA